MWGKEHGADLVPEKAAKVGRYRSPQTNCPEKLIFMAEELGMVRVSPVVAYASSYNQFAGLDDPSHITFKAMFY
jgi:hypothetical protein